MADNLLHLIITSIKNAPTTVRYFRSSNPKTDFWGLCDMILVWTRLLCYLQVISNMSVSHIFMILTNYIFHQSGLTDLEYENVSGQTRSCEMVLSFSRTSHATSKVEVSFHTIVKNPFGFQWERVTEESGRFIWGSSHTTAGSHPGAGWLM